MGAPSGSVYRSYSQWNSEDHEVLRIEHRSSKCQLLRSVSKHNLILNEVNLLTRMLRTLGIMEKTGFLSSPKIELKDVHLKNRIPLICIHAK